MLGVSPVRVAPKGTVIGTYERSLGLDIAHLPSYPPLLNRFMVAGLHCYYGGSDYCSWSLFLGFASWFAPCSLMLGAGPGSLVSQTPSKTGSLPGICVLATSSSPCLSRLDFGPFHLQPPAVAPGPGLVSDLGLTAATAVAPTRQGSARRHLGFAIGV